MRKSFYAAMAVVASACIFGAACDDEETTTATTATGSGSTPSGTATGCDDPVDSECVELCENLYGCIQEQPTMCPDLDGYPESDYMCGTTGPGCYDQCDANPALKAVVDPADCATTIGTRLTLNPSFAESCGVGTGGGGGGTAGGGTGGNTGGMGTGGNAGGAGGG